MSEDKAYGEPTLPAIMKGRNGAPSIVRGSAGSWDTTKDSAARGRAAAPRKDSTRWPGACSGRPAGHRSPCHARNRERDQGWPGEAPICCGPVARAAAGTLLADDHSKGAFSGKVWIDPKAAFTPGSQGVLGHACSVTYDECQAVSRYRSKPRSSDTRKQSHGARKGAQP
jgi:hypothetical protein